MKNFVQPGENITLAASPYAVSSGEGVLVGRLFGVAAGDADNGAEVDIVTEGVFDLAKDAGDVFMVGAPVYFDVTEKNCRSGEDDDSNSAGESEALIGVAIEAAGAGASTVRVKLSPAPVTLV